MKKPAINSRIHLWLTVLSFVTLNLQAENDRPNILLAISDDQSWPHAGAYGDTTVSTPGFDRIAKEGVLFTHALVNASQCSPSRATLLTGRNIWQLEEAGTQGSIFPAKFTPYTDILKSEGYFVGYTGKPWGPGSWQDGGRDSNPSGLEYNEKKLVPPTRLISDRDYAENFKDFLSDRPDDTPFHFWYGCHEPHRNYEEDSAIKAGKSTEGLVTPEFWPNNDIIRRDFLDYKLEIDWFDIHLSKIIQTIEEAGELENTLIIITSDNGMPFPRAKATLYEAGTRVPLAISWPKRIPGNRVVDDLVSFIDIAPTILEAVGLDIPPDITGISLYDLLASRKVGLVGRERDYVLLGKERHNYARADNLGYPTRAIRTQDYLYIQNLKPERWPMGDPPWYWCHTKLINPVKRFILENKDNGLGEYFYEITYAKKTEEELYDIRNDFACINNLTTDPNYNSIRKELALKLTRLLTQQGDPRMLGYGDIFESYPIYQRLPEKGFPGFFEYGTYNTKYSR